ncbi:MAG: hypothetical protein GXO89_11645 [Chlorobi bacterium]|nr:hypothetical protein [Chlorobiota bacterium]
MTTIIINSGLKEGSFSFNTPLQAVEKLLDEMDFVLLQPIKNTEVLARVKKHAKENVDRALETYDNI